MAGPSASGFVQQQQHQQHQQEWDDGDGDGDQDQDQDEHDGPEKKKRKRNRAALSCTNCKARKIKWCVFRVDPSQDGPPDDARAESNG